MRHHIFLGLLAAIAATGAYAENPAHTLDAQMQAMQPQQTPAPVYQYKQSVDEHANRVPSAGGNVQALGSGAIPAMPLEIRTVGDVRYLTGGVSDEEESQLKMVEQDYNLRLLLTGIGGAYVSDANARITDSSDRLVLSSDGVGPYLYASLPPGTYKVEVTAPQGGIKTAEVKVPASGAAKPQMRFTE